jgi:hypothetical protein
LWQKEIWKVFLAARFVQNIQQQAGVQETEHAPPVSTGLFNAASCKITSYSNVEFSEQAEARYSTGMAGETGFGGLSASRVEVSPRRAGPPMR